jgi:DNA-binding NarL/FixJ family response regulator
MKAQQAVPSPKAIRLLLADDHRLFRNGLMALLEKAEGVTVVGAAEEGQETVELVRELKPDVVVMDISMPGLNGVEATRQIKATMPATKVLCLSMHEELRFVDAALEAGAEGYLMKDAEPEEFLRAIQLVEAGEIYLCPRVLDSVMAKYRNQQGSDESSTLPQLSTREREIVQLLAQGKTIKQIAEGLCISVKTVHTHKEHILKKLQIDSLAGLIKYALQEGLTSLHE